MKKEITSQELYNLIHLRPAVYGDGTTNVIYELELKNASLYRTPISECNAIKTKVGDTCSIRANVIYNGKRCGVVTIYLEDRELTSFVIHNGIEHINMSLIAELEVVYATYGAFEYINDSEVVGYKLKRILEKETIENKDDGT